MKVLASAHRHGISTADMLHAYRNRVRVFLLDDGLIVIGATSSGALVELGVTFDETWIFHAMPARRKFLHHPGHTR
ncbi:hypothetical protein [Nocardioides sp.]|jgi:hypothetical protein|uniref:hypothetical protein n=1 Tax=Nocardioides sp. TaxID=35761 RepID=UPI002630BB72|nr:hypothetical protein [Nocardioides sp.]